jgi:hypothetical protein
VSLEAIWDAVARESATIEGIKAAYAPGAGGQGSTVRVMPSDISDTPVTYTVYSGSDLSPQSWERITHRFEVRVYFRATEISGSLKTAAVYVSRFVAAWRDNVDLFATCTMSVIEGFDGFVDETINGKPFIYLPVRVRADEVSGQTYTV